MRSLGCPWHRNSGRFHDACVGAVCGREERGGGREGGEKSKVKRQHFSFPSRTPLQY